MTLLSAAEKARDALEPFALFGEWLAEVKKDEISVVVQMANFKRARTAHALLSQCLDDGGEGDFSHKRLAYERLAVPLPENEIERIRNTELYTRGDTIAVWVNEGDLYSAEVRTYSTSPKSPAPTVEEVARVIAPDAFNNAGWNHEANKAAALRKATAIIALLHAGQSTKENTQAIRSMPEKG